MFFDFIVAEGGEDGEAGQGLEPRQGAEGEQQGQAEAKRKSRRPRRKKSANQQPNGEGSQIEGGICLFIQPCLSCLIKLSYS